MPPSETFRVSSKWSSLKMCLSPDTRGYDAPVPGAGKNSAAKCA
jgi:hypothetical protein